MFFLSHCYQSPLPCWESQSISPPQHALQHFSDLWSCCEGSPDSNLVLLLCFCLQCPQLSELVHFILWECSVTFYIFCRHRICLVDHVDLIHSFYSCGKALGLLPQTHCPWVSAVVLFPPLYVSRPVGFAPEAALEELGLPCEVQVWRWCNCVSCRGSGRPGIQGSWWLWQLEIQCSRRVRKTVLAHMLQYSCLESPSLTEKPGRPQSTGAQRVGHY